MKTTNFEKLKMLPLTEEKKYYCEQKLCFISNKQV